MLNLTKPLRLLDGGLARLLTNDLKGEWPIAVAVLATDNQSETVYVFDMNGNGPFKYIGLINAPPQPVTIRRWVAVRRWQDEPLGDGWTVYKWKDVPFNPDGDIVVGPIDITFTPKE